MLPILAVTIMNWLSRSGEPVTGHLYLLILRRRHPTRLAQE